MTPAAPAAPLPAPLPAFAPLTAQGSEPLYRQLYDRVRAAVAAGTLAPGDRVPSARALAKELGVARGTVELAYELLASEGYLLARGQAGTVVNPALQPRAAAPAPQAARPRAPQPTPQPEPQPAPLQTPAEDVLVRPAQLLPFQMGVPALDAFPRKLWARLGARYLRGMQTADFDYPPPHGLPALRSAIASYLQMARGIDCGAHQVFVTTGHRSSLQLATLALTQPGQRAWVEDPGYPPTRQLLQAAGLATVAVPVDAQGLDVARGMALAPDATVVAVTPAHQSPLSMSLALPRRQALLEWAAASGAWVFEDDYDGEYRYASRPLPALASLDRHGRVLYAGTFSKVLFPGIRLAYLVVPPAAVAAFERAGRTFFAGATPAITQSIVADFMAEGHFSRHIQRMRQLYAQRRAETLAALERGLGGTLRAQPQPGGMHLVVRLPGERTDRPLAARLLAQGMAVQALSPWSATGSGDAALLLSFTQSAAPALAERLGVLIRESL
ncbi:MAG: PLP-dependent aminotransferase family protein [Comamonadaceae bacterium]|nr:MAG: PLP-dependent aminotransferase family protein [Comamonadaceae bacterium]